MLDRFRKAKAAEIRRLRELEAAGRTPSFYTGQRPGFSRSLLARGPGAVIAEYKRASPSRGDIDLASSPEDVAEAYAGGGAAAISVLTEEAYFKGEIGYLARMAGAGLPMLRKDFLFDPLQVGATAATPASALLLVARMFETAAQLTKMNMLSAAAGIEAVVEIFDERDLDMAREAGARIIQVNARDLDSLAVDHDNVFRLVRARGEGEVWISASGIERREDVLRRAEAGYDAVLVGTALMASGDPERALAGLTGRA